jgi:hypothetical protein
VRVVGTRHTRNNSRYSTRAATVVIAAADSSSQSKKGADYHSAGNDEITDAITDLPPNGGKVLLMEGTYDIDSSVLINKSSVFLEGMGYGTILRLAEGANTSVIKVGNEGESDIYDSKIKNLAIDGNSAQQTGTSHGIFCDRKNWYTEINNVKVVNALTDCINVFNTADGLGSGVNICNCRLYTAGRDGINCTDHHALNVRDTIIGGYNQICIGRDGIRVTSANSHVFRRVAIMEAAGNAIFLDASGNGLMDRIDVGSCDKGFHFNGGGSDYNQIIAGSIEDCRISLFLNWSFNNQFYNLLLPYTKRDGIQLISSDRNRFNGLELGSCGYETDNSYYGIKLNNSKYNSFTECNINVDRKNYANKAAFAVYELGGADYNDFIGGYIRPDGAVQGVFGGRGVNGRTINTKGYVTDTKGIAAPTTGTWKVGDICINSEPAAGEYMGWICVTAGTPGTWKGYGLIESP